jgi:SAM-dependent methyltransferase
MTSVVGSMTSIRRRSTCRLCDSRNMAHAFSLTPTPPANAFVPAEAVSVAQDVFPLELFFCEDCTHLQLVDVVDPELLFGNYVYVSGTSPSFVRHFESYSDAVARLVALAPGALVVDIGSNDGTLLRAFRNRHGARVLGVDPARNLAEMATASGIETIPDFFSAALAQTLAAERGRAAIVTANNVFAHVDDIGGVADGVRALLADDGVFVFEVSYLTDVVEGILFDTIYHEHLCYHAVRPLIPFFERHGLELIEAFRVSAHGGSLRGVAQLQNGPRPRGSSVARAVAKEAELGLGRIESYRALSRRIDALGAELRDLLSGLRAQGKSIAGFGAPAKATTLMYHFGIGADVVDFIVDDSPLKQGMFTPGMHIPVVPARAIDERRPDYVLVLAWNFAAPIIAKNAAFQSRGGQFIVPVPKVEVI